MIKLPLIAALAFVAAAPAVAAPAAERQSFTQDGVTYFYTQTKVGDSLVIKGHAVDGPDFYYVVRNGQVVGKTDDNSVSFSVADAMANRGSVEVASAR
ncbi:MAG: hypothetical protein J7485_02800 [Sphingobium sp.]|nr:hypothetical protein [Sphingobium sp.]